MHIFKRFRTVTEKRKKKNGIMDKILCHGIYMCCIFISKCKYNYTNIKKIKKEFRKRKKKVKKKFYLLHKFGNRIYMHLYVNTNSNIFKIFICSKSITGLRWMKGDNREIFK